MKKEILLSFMVSVVLFSILLVVIIHNVGNLDTIIKSLNGDPFYIDPKHVHNHPEKRWITTENRKKDIFGLSAG